MPVAVEQSSLAAIERSLVRRFGKQVRPRLSRGLRQTALLWSEKDGSFSDFRDFCLGNFLAEGQQLDAQRKRLEGNLETLYGHLNKISLDLKRPLHVELGERLPLDLRFSQYDPYAHLVEDLFANKIAFWVVLNFPFSPLAEKLERGPDWSRPQWAAARLGDLFTSRPPAAIHQAVAAALAGAEAYISEYKIPMDRLLDRQGQAPFRRGLKLISHWGLRDELKALYADRQGRQRQEIIYRLMQSIVRQEFPLPLLSAGDSLWDSLTRRLVENNKRTAFICEPNTRYQNWLQVFRAVRDLDPFFPLLPSHIRRKFESEREIPEAEVRGLLERVLTSDEVRRLARLIVRRLDRPLRPFDIWYSGFSPKGRLSSRTLEAAVRRLFPSSGSFVQKIPALLRSLGFSTELARYVAERIVVEPARSGGHAWGAQMHSEKSHLRAPAPDGRLNFQGFNVAMHELGHCVEQTLSLQFCDQYILNGVPNTAFSEAFAFVFQGHDTELLDFPSPDRSARCQGILNSLWMTYEIAGVALIDIEVWHWLYEHPRATPANLKQAVLGIAAAIWNRYYGDVFSCRDEVLLAIYSHLVEAALYVPDYPLGHLIKFQLDEFLRGKKLGKEMERMCRLGRLTPHLWMRRAVGQPLSAEPLLSAARSALDRIAD